LECRRVTVRDTLIHSFHVVNQFNANAFGVLHGGTMISWLVDAASVAAARVARGYAALAGIDFLALLTPVFVGEHLDVAAWVGYVGRSSLEVGVAAVAEGGGGRRLAAAAHATMVALDSDLRPRPVGVCLEPGPGGVEAWRLSRELREGGQRRWRLESKRVLVAAGPPEPGVECPARESRRFVNPADSVAYNIMHAGSLLFTLDELSAITAAGCAGGGVVTGGVFSSDFITPIHVGEVIEPVAAVVLTGRSSLLVEVRVKAYNAGSPSEARTAARAFFRMVHVGPDGRPRPLPRRPRETPAAAEARRLDEEFRMLQEMAESRVRRVLEELSPGML